MTVDFAGEEEKFNMPPPVPKMKSHKEDVRSLEDTNIVLDGRGCFEQESTATSLLAQMASSRSSSLIHFEQAH